MKLYNIEAGIPFARALAAELLRRADGKPEELSRMRLLLPTRRACRTVRDAFLDLSQGKPLLLPRLQPLGDIDEDELSFGAEHDFALPPAIDPLRRQILLARAVITRPGFEQGPAHAMALAGALGRLMDRVHTENLDMQNLPALAGEAFAAHWQVTLDFLTILSAEWPGILKSLGVIDAADRRNRLINALADYWGRHPPALPVIAAGSTGSIPATARLLKVIASLPQGAVVLPGLDIEMDADSWAAIDDAHPQATLKHLLQEFGVGRESVKPWPGEKTESRAWLATELMRPAAATGAWAELRGQKTKKAAVEKSLQHVMRCDADTVQEEARLIAVLLRGALEIPGKTAALVTPDRGLARRVAAECRRWDIAVDDSAGQPMPDTGAGIFLRMCAQACIKQLSPSALLSLLRHRLCNQPHDLVSALETTALRGAKPPPGIEGLRNRLREEGDDKTLRQFLGTIENALAPFLKIADGKPQAFTAFLDTHIKAAESLAGADKLWSGDDGASAAIFLSSLRENAAALPEMNAESYLAVLEQAMGGVTVRPSWGAHPRLSILGQLEARMLQADLVILGGLNEGTWPPDAGHDPWMSRPMMKQFGLPPPERSIGLSAHDFAQGFCAAELVLTRAKRADGAPTVPARWLQRLDAVLQALEIEPASLTSRGERWLHLVRGMDRSEKQEACARPAPCPPVALRPRELPVTKIETWMNDPYGIYARYVLNLRKLDPLEKAPDAADRGTFLHAVMEKFTDKYPDKIPADAAKILTDIGRALLTERADDPGFWEFWWPRFERIAGWTAAHEKEWRTQATPLKSEVKGRMTLGNFTLTARADRIDRLRDGSHAVIDYKSSGSSAAPPSKIASGDAPQLPLEGLILQSGGFEGVAGNAGWLGYWVMTGGVAAGEVKCVDDNLDDVIARAQDGLAKLIARFDDPATPYFSVPDPDRAPRYNDYEQLARLQEWTALGEIAEEAA